MTTDTRQLLLLLFYFNIFHSRYSFIAAQQELNQTCWFLVELNQFFSEFFFMFNSLNETSANVINNSDLSFWQKGQTIYFVIEASTNSAFLAGFLQKHSYCSYYLANSIRRQFIYYIKKWNFIKQNDKNYAEFDW